MSKSVHTNCPTYIELDMQDGQIKAVNGKTFNEEGIHNVMDYICGSENVETEDVLSKIKGLTSKDGSVTLKIYDGLVSTL